MFDGKLVDIDQPVARLEDRGYQFGDGVYDAWCLLNGRHFLLDDHLNRLQRSCNLIGIKPSFSHEEMIEIIGSMTKESGLKDALVYVQYTRGWSSPRAHACSSDIRPLFSGTISPLKPYPQEYFTVGAAAISHPDERHLLCHVKSLNLLGSVLAKNAAAAAGCYESLLIREIKGKNVVTECAHSNCFAVKDGALYTSPNGNYILPGITRAAVIDLAKKNGIPVVEEFVPLDFYLNADEAMITNSLAVIPLVKIDGKPVGAGTVGAVTKRIMALYEERIQDVCYR
jgi:D-alanine transaminase